MAAFMNFYNFHCYHESIDNVTTADAYVGRSREILKRKEVQVQARSGSPSGTI